VTTKDDVKLAWLSYDLAWERWRRGAISEEQVTKVLHNAMKIQLAYDEAQEKLKKKREELHKPKEN
jgi:phosphoserine phosphatase